MAEEKIDAADDEFVLGLWQKPVVNNLNVALGKYSKTLEHRLYHSGPLSHDHMDVTRNDSASWI